MLLENMYEVLTLSKVDDSTFEASVKINKTHEIFKGHFPNNPVTPGVVMLQILKNCVESHLNVPLLMHKTSNVKFLALVNPEVDNVLNFNITFQYKNDTVIVKNQTSFKDGRPVLKCNVTFAIYLHE